MAGQVSPFFVDKNVFCDFVQQQVGFIAMGDLAKRRILMLQNGCCTPRGFPFFVNCFGVFRADQTLLLFQAECGSEANLLSALFEVVPSQYTIEQIDLMKGAVKSKDRSAFYQLCCQEADPTVRAKMFTSFQHLV
jgi:hypothetical protein